MDWSKLKIFHIVYEAGSFSKASQVLNISQSSISRHIRHLEDHLQTSLFFRQTDGITPTEQAEFLYQTTQEIYSKLSLIQSLLSDGPDIPQGVLRIGCPAAFTLWGLAQPIPDFLADYPELQVEVFIDNGQEKFSDFRQIDVLLHNLPIFYDGIVSKTILKQPLGIYASRTYLKEKGAPYKPKHLNHHRLICFDETYPLPVPQYNLLLELGAETENPRTPFIKINNLWGIAQAISEGLGIGLLTPNIAKYLKHVVQILPDVSCPYVEYILSYPEQFKKTPRVLAFEQFICEKIKI